MFAAKPVRTGPDGAPLRLLTVLPCWPSKRMDELAAKYLQRFCRERRWQPHAVEGGLSAVVERWAERVRHLRRRTPMFRAEYVNDLDVRQLLYELWETSPAEQRAAIAGRLAEVDGEFVSLTVRVAECVWGEANAREHGWEPDVNWWYFRVPAGFTFMGDT